MTVLGIDRTERRPEQPHDVGTPFIGQRSPEDDTESQGNEKLRYPRMSI